MNSNEIDKDYVCEIDVNNYRVGIKVEYQIVVHISFYSSKHKCKAKTMWSMWRSFSQFQTLDKQLRQNNASIMRMIKFASLHRSRSFFGATKSTKFLDTRQKELDKYMKNIAKNSTLLEFHKDDVCSHCLKSFVGFVGGFGTNPWYSNAEIRRNMSSSRLLKNTQRNRYKLTSTSLAEIKKNNNSSFRLSHVNMRTRSSEVIKGDQLSFTHNFPKSTNSSMSLPSKDKLMVQRVAPVDEERRKMEESLNNHGLQGVGMPPDGSCFLHCLVYEMFPLGCLNSYDHSLLTVNVGITDGKAPRRIAAAKMLRKNLTEYALEHIKVLSSFLMQNEEELSERYKLFGESSSEQATVAELYASASMFNIEIHLITNDRNFEVDPVLPIRGLPHVRRGKCRQLVFGYLIPRESVPGHYICTRSALGWGSSLQNSGMSSNKDQLSLTFRDSKKMYSNTGIKIDHIPEHVAA